MAGIARLPSVLTQSTFLVSERAQSCSCSIEISDTYVYICGGTSSYLRMLNSSLLRNEKLRGPLVLNVGRVKFLPLSKA